MNSAPEAFSVWSERSDACTDNYHLRQKTIGPKGLEGVSGWKQLEGTCTIASTSHKGGHLS